MRSSRLLGSAVVLAALLAAPANAIVVDPQIYYRWASAPGYTCSTSAGTITVLFANQPIEWNNMAVAQYKVIYVTNGVPTPTGPFSAPTASGSQVYGPLSAHPPAYPANVTVQFETYLGGTLKYESSMSATCSGDGSGTATIVEGARGTPIDFTGDGRSDFSIVRNTGGGPSGAVTWWTGDAASTAYSVQLWGIASDFYVPADYDGDGKNDFAIWRPGAAGVAGFWILRSSDGVVTFTPFGQTGDDPSVVGDYDGDGKTDIAVYRAGATAGAQSYWYYKSSLTGAVVATAWGMNGDFPAPGDYDGDGKADFAIQRNGGGGQGVFWIKQTTAGIINVPFGTPTDVVVPGDYDGDGKTDLAVVRGVSGGIQWWIRRSSDLVITAQTFGLSATDFPCQGDYDGDGKTDMAIWRPSAIASQSAFWVYRSLDAGVTIRQWGQNGDYPVANYNSH